jgi:hypothetical protein
MSHELPPPEVQQGLLDALKTLISRKGHERFIRAPLIETTPRFFPDAWQPDLDGVRALALRLLAYAGLEELDVDVEPFVNEEDVLWPGLVQGESHSRQKHGTAAWFRGIEEGCCLLGVDLALVTDPERLVGVLAHEVAHAWRFHHGLMVEDSELEEELTDLTTLYLGFGILTVNGTYRYRARGEVSGGMVSTEWSFASGGYLPLEAMCFLLAVQAVARRMDSGEVRHLQRQLEPNQAASFRHALQELEPEKEALAETLRIPSPERWPPPWTELPVPAALRAAPVSSPVLHTVPEPEVPEREPLYNEGRPVFRFRRTRPFAAFLWPFVGVLLLIPLKAFLGTQWTLLIVPASLVAALVLKRDYCSGTGCEVILEEGVTVCPSCGGTVAGVIERLRDRFDAEADYWRKVRAEGKVLPDELDGDLDGDELPEELPKRGTAS